MSPNPIRRIATPDPIETSPETIRVASPYSKRRGGGAGAGVGFYRYWDARMRGCMRASGTFVI